MFDDFKEKPYKVNKLAKYELDIAWEFPLTTDLASTVIKPL